MNKICPLLTKMIRFSDGERVICPLQTEEMRYMDGERVSFPINKNQLFSFTFWRNHGSRYQVGYVSGIPEAEIFG